MQLLLRCLGAPVSRQRACNCRVPVFVEFPAFRIPTLATELRICNTWNDRGQIFLLVWQTYQLLFGSLLAVDLWDIPPCPSRRCTDKRPCIWSPRSIRFAGPDAFYCHVNVRWVMTDFVLFYFMLFLTVLIYSVVANIESWGWVRWWEGLLVLRAGLLAGLTALWLEPRESLHQIERHPEQLEESQGWPAGLFSPPEKVVSPSDLLFSDR